MDVRKALEETRGDFEKAKKWLLRKGLTKAGKKAKRKTKDGLIEAYIHAGGKAGAIVNLACESDFVAKTKEFKNLAHELAMQITSMEPENIDELLTQDYIRDNTKKIDDLVKEAIAKLGENIRVVEFKVLKI